MSVTLCKFYVTPTTYFKGNKLFCKKQLLRHVGQSNLLVLPSFFGKFGDSGSHLFQLLVQAAHL